MSPDYLADGVQARPASARAREWHLFTLHTADIMDATAKSD